MGMVVKERDPDGTKSVHSSFGEGPGRPSRLHKSYSTLMPSHFLAEGDRQQPQASSRGMDHSLASQLDLVSRGARQHGLAHACRWLTIPVVNFETPGGSRGDARWW